MWREEFTEQLLKDNEIMEFAANVEVVKDDELDALYDEKWPSIVEVTLKDGTVITARHDLPKGEPEVPVTDEELTSKFMSLAGDALEPYKAKEVLQKIMNLEKIHLVKELTELL